MLWKLDISWGFLHMIPYIYLNEHLWMAPSETVFKHPKEIDQRYFEKDTRKLHLNPLWPLMVKSLQSCA